jgi:hypothetical protein
MTDFEQQIEDFIRQVFDDNYEQLRLEGAGTLAPASKEFALQQVLYYWRKLSHIAQAVTDTEVKLTLPNQITPAGRRFTVEGVVDIVQEQDRTVMYDIKTHTADDVRANLDAYEPQLNVYAHIWQQLRGQPLDEAAIIATRFPSGLRNALASESPAFIAEELACWEPVIPIAYDPGRVADTISDFAAVVDAVEENQFAPRPVGVLNEQMGGTRKTFGALVCLECDARFSCASFRAYATGGRSGNDRAFARYYADYGPDAEQEEWRTAGLEQVQ